MRASLLHANRSPPLSNSHTTGQYAPSSKSIQDQVPDSQGQSLCRKNPPKLFKLASSKVFPLPWLAFPMETPIKERERAFYSSISPSACFHLLHKSNASSVVLHGVAWPLLLGNVANKFFHSNDLSVLSLTHMNKLESCGYKWDISNLKYNIYYQGGLPVIGKCQDQSWNYRNEIEHRSWLVLWFADHFLPTYCYGFQQDLPSKIKIT